MKVFRQPDTETLKLPPSWFRAAAVPCASILKAIPSSSTSFKPSSRSAIPHVTTLHGRLDLPDLPLLYKYFPRQPVISISNSQRTPLPNLNWIATVYHGLPENLFHLNEKPGPNQTNFTN